MSMISRQHDEKVCHKANQERWKLMCQLKCLTGQLSECDRRPLNPYPRRENPAIKYNAEPVQEPPNRAMYCPRNDPSGIVKRNLKCKDNETCCPQCVPCSASIRNLCDGFPQWFTDYVGELECSRKPVKVGICDECLEDMSCKPLVKSRLS